MTCEALTRRIENSGIRYGAKKKYGPKVACGESRGTKEYEIVRGPVKVIMHLCPEHLRNVERSEYWVKEIEAVTP